MFDKILNTFSIISACSEHAYLLTILEMAGHHFQNVTTNLSFAQSAFNHTLKKF